jgi:hypothetical protein
VQQVPLVQMELLELWVQRVPQEQRVRQERLARQVPLVQMELLEL